MSAAASLRFGGMAAYIRTMGLFLIVWWLASTYLVKSPLLLPSPVAVARALYENAASGELFVNAFISLGRLLLSVSAAVCIAVPLGLLMGRSLLWRDLLELPVELLRPIAGIAWIPLALAIFGIGNRLPIFIMFYTAFFPLIIGTAAGAAGVDKRLVSAARTMGVSQRKILTRVVLPAALPAILVALRLAVAASWTAVVAAELVGAPSGLGYGIEFYRSMLSTPTVLAYIVMIGLLGYLTDRALRAAATHIAPWAATGARR